MECPLAEGLAISFTIEARDIFLMKEALQSKDHEGESGTTEVVPQPPAVSRF